MFIKYSASWCLSQISCFRILVPRPEVFLFFIYSLLYFSIIFYPPYTLFYLHSPSSPCNHHTVVHVHESFFFFAWSIYALASIPKLSACSLSMSLKSCIQRKKKYEMVTLSVFKYAANQILYRNKTVICS